MMYISASSVFNVTNCIIEAPCHSFALSGLFDCERASATMMFLRGLTCIALAAQAAALSIGGRQMHIERDSDGLQDIVSSA